MAKKIVDEDMVLNIIINGDKGRAELNKLERAIKDLSIANEELAVKKTRVEQRMKNSKQPGRRTPSPTKIWKQKSDNCLQQWIVTNKL